MIRSIYRPPWRIDLDLRRGVRSHVAGAELARVVATALDVVHAPSPASIGLILSDDKELAALNATHMGTTGPTDVLSFPLLPPTAFAEGADRDAGGSAPAFALPPGRRIHLGDVVVSVERAVEQARSGRGGQTGDVQWSARDELRLLVTHGVLHVCGKDHADQHEEAAMRDLEQRLLSPRP